LTLGACGWGIGIGEEGTNNLIGDGTLANANDIQVAMRVLFSMM